jgi:TrmH family RNA methyltransferase
MITSPDNPNLKELRKLARRSARERSGRFVAEGEDLIAAADAAEWKPLLQLCVAGGVRGRRGWLEVEERLLHAVSMLGSGTRELAVYEQRWAPPRGPLCVYLHAVRDPGNVGTVIRSTHALGAASVALGPGCADPYGPKAVRASMGAIFSVPVARVDGPGGLPGELIGLDAAAAESLVGPPKGEATLLVGAERDGLPAEVLEACDRVCAIRIVAGDSLNAAMAATVAIYELTRVALP